MTYPSYEIDPITKVRTGSGEIRDLTGRYWRVVQVRQCKCCPEGWHRGTMRVYVVRNLDS